MTDITGYSIDQLELLIKRYPLDPVEIEGVVLDYVGQSGCPLDQIFNMNNKIYIDLFTGTNKDKGKHLLACIIDSETTAKELANRCKEIFSNVPQMIKELTSQEIPGADRMAALAKDPEKHLEHSVSAIIWHLSDMHFGKLNVLQSDPREMAFILAKLSKDYPKLTPDIVIISGDVSSISKEEEYEHFVLFCKTLGEALWDLQCPERILVVPGNHDVTWLGDGSADHGRMFARIVSEAKCCITPFGKKKQTFDDNQVKIIRYIPEIDTIPPVAIVEYKKFDLCFILLVSNHFSGIVPEEIRKSLERLPDENELLTLLRIDDGAINSEYIYHIASNVSTAMQTSIGVVHHNPIQYGVEICTNRLAPYLLETLWKKDVPIVLHGHTHQVDDRLSYRPKIPGHSYPIPAPTLSSIPTAGSTHGLNILLVSEPGSIRKIDVLLWNISSSYSFKPDGLIHRYRFTIRDGSIEVEHEL